jgi:hypothetical protein
MPLHEPEISTFSMLNEKGNEPCSILHLQHNKAWSQDLGSSNLLFGCYLTNSRLPRNIANIDLTGSQAKMSVMIYH